MLKWRTKMAGVKLSQTEMQYINMLLRVVNVSVKDCIVDEENNRVIYVVAQGQAGLAIGRRGSNIARLKELIAKDVEIVEYSPDMRTFIKNCFLPIVVREIKFQERRNGTIVKVKVDSKDTGRAIGRNGKNINRVKKLVTRQFDVQDVLIEQ